ncbi:hypothetical protein JOC86_001816 [Bacillus pakistanensis]|uniref:TATA-box binding protein n=1 Tax=Rossellomorea pakistanensis TaxID=992288 RepID=A0ABS2NBY9_9BACI|nr:YwmB family TATA-box binding protein [Bacillus pakistanensis]MBM7585274.1 hypothetical protein [Bacillus pakistanensis]
MKRIIQFALIITIGIGLTYFYYGNNTTAANQQLEIEKLVEAVEKSDGDIIEWSLYARENLDFSTSKGFASYYENMRAKYPDFQWTHTKSNEDIVIKGLQKHQDGEESIKLISTDKNGQKSSYLIYEFRGSGWNSKKAQSVRKHFLPKLEEIFNGEPLIFSCIEGEFSDTLDEVLSKRASKLLNDLGAKEVESLKEENFISISAYSKEFKHSVPTENNLMNMQLGLRDEGMGAKTTFVIGTPIITIEY